MGGRNGRVSCDIWIDEEVKQKSRDGGKVKK
jgi:hypothetical protein